MDHAIVEDVDGCVASCDGRVYLAKAKELSGEVARARDKIRQMQTKERELREQMLAAGLCEEAADIGDSMTGREGVPLATGAASPASLSA